MKNLSLTLFAILTIVMTSCRPEPCEDVTCLNGGICESGECVCADGYEGPNCATEQRLAFVGTYAVDESCNLANATYTITIAADSEVGTEVTLHNLGDFDFDITGVVNGTTVTFTDQMGGGSTVNGTGELADSVLTINYTLVTAVQQTLTCEMTCTLN